MHKSTLTVALFAALTTITALSPCDTPAAQADDFSALLADLSFGNEPALNEAPTAIARAPQAMLETPVMLNEAPKFEEVASDEVPEMFDLEAAFAAQEAKASIPAQTVGHLRHHHATPGCSGADEGCASAGCDDQVEACTPHVPVRLPTSSFYQYFRSNKCNSSVWDGYRQPCRSANAHLNGTCDCFDEKRDCCLGDCDCGEIVECTDCQPRHRRPILPRKQRSRDCDVQVGGCDG